MRSDSLMAIVEHTGALNTINGEEAEQRENDNKR